jgi:hypothetical protein
MAQQGRQQQEPTEANQPGLLALTDLAVGIPVLQGGEDVNFSGCGGYTVFKVIFAKLLGETHMLQESVVSKSVHSRYYGTLPKQAVDLEDAGGKRSAKAGYQRDWNAVVPRGHNTKGLRRYLASRVGASWDRVLADIKVLLRKDALYNAAEHLEYWVLVHCYLAVDGTLMASQGCYTDVPGADAHYPFYVHPVSHTLQRFDYTEQRAQDKARRAQRAAEKASTRLELGDGTLALKVAGVWYWIEFAPVPECDSLGMELDWALRWERDAVLGRSLRWLTSGDLSAAYGRKGVYAKGRRQLSSKDLRKYGLS